MALPLASPTSKALDRLRSIAQSSVRPIFAVVLAMIAGCIVIMVTSPGSLFARFTEALAAYQALFYGAFGNPQNLSFTLTAVTPLILCSISVALAFRGGLFNIGAEGQLAMGAMTAGIIGFEGTHLPGWILIPAMLIGSVLVGAIWGGIVGVLKAWRGAHEVVTTIMLNWIAFYFTDYLINGPFQSKHTANQTDALPAQATLPHIANFYNQTLGSFLPKIVDPQQYLVDVGLFFAIAALIFYWFLTSRTTFGYEVRVIGQNPKAARYAGIPVKRNIIVVMTVAGAFSGLAGSLQLMGQFPYQLIATTFSIQTTGLDAIGVALLGRTTGFGIFLASLLFGGLRQGGTVMQISANVPGDLVYIIQALVLFSIAAEFLPTIRRTLPRWLSLTRRPALVPATTGLTVTNLENGTNPTNGNIGDGMEPVDENNDGSTALAKRGSAEPLSALESSPKPGEEE
jgi:ABC-type uncharacterized transport system permease subunit